MKELSYQMEDIVDAFMVSVDDGGEQANPNNRFKKLIKKIIRLFKEGRDLHRISDAMEEAVGQSKQLAELRQRYEQETWDTSNGASVDPRIMALYTDVEELVGIEGPRDELINMLAEDDTCSEHPLKTVSIFGFGGLGKTTIAKTTYDKIRVQFDCDAFVSVSQNPDIRKVFKDILYELDKDMYEDIHNSIRDERQLIGLLKDFLQNKRYLIVIDDIWDKYTWQLINCAFSKNSFGSRLITTTRILSVSEACCSSSDDIYRMKPLSNDVSRLLFHRRVFYHEKECPQELVQVSEDILNKCGGIPLAIITIGSLLVNNNQRKTKGQWYALLNSIGRGLMEDRSVEAMKKILLLSYYDLPSYLKPCLLYLSIFPEDHMIMRDKLIWRWISEGFVHSESNETNLYELGDSYFNELVNRSLIQPICIDDEEKVEACRIHDMVLGLICSLSSEENFVTILDGTERKMPNSQSKVRRLSIRNSKVDADTISMAHVRTVCFTNNIVGQVLNISSCQVLRVLDLEGCRISDIGYVGNLLHLRYLGLKDTDVEVLPIEIGKVKFLETLDLRRTRIKELPSSVVMLRRLMCLYVSYDMKLPSGIGNMISLEVLEKLYVGKLSSHGVDFHVFRELGHLTKLRVLGLTCEDLDESLCKALVESLGNMHKLEILCIFADSGRVDLMHKGWVPSVQLRRLIIQGWTCPFQTLPTWINPSSLPLLSHLFIGVAEVGSEDIKILGMLPALRHLHLTGGASISEEHAVEILIATSDAFPCATWCYFENITMAPSTFPRGAAPRLKYLRFDFPAMWITRGDCDFCMRHLPSLGKVTVNLIRGKATDSEVNEAEAALRAAAEDHPNRPVLEVEMR